MLFDHIYGLIPLFSRLCNDIPFLFVLRDCQGC